MNNEEQNQDFGKLQHLLKLKRYEQPPPRYFNDFSGRVLSHIRAGKSVSRFETINDFVSRTPWLRRLWRKLENRPALAGAVATAACGLMVAGAFLMEETKPQNMDFMAVGRGAGAGDKSTTGSALGNNLPTLAAAPQLVSSTNISPLPTGSNLFEHLPSLQTVPVSGPPLLQK